MRFELVSQRLSEHLNDLRNPNSFELKFVHREPQINIADIKLPTFSAAEASKHPQPTKNNVKHKCTL